MYTSIATLTAALAATASAFDCSGPYFSFYNRAGNAMSSQRLDPALYPGTQSPHLHSFDGGNALASEMTYETTQSSSCTTARIKPDKSLYWRPTLFWNGNNTGYYRVPDKFLKLYYKFGDGNARANVTEFPEDFSMIAGDPLKRADGDNPAGIKWACLGKDYSRIDATGFPTGFTSCKEGLTSEITFPACWNGKAMDPASPRAHMAYPTAGGKGLDACPSTHKHSRFPTIFIEFWYDVSAFDGQYSADSNPWVLSNGDPTGYGFHADFRNGWEKGVLAKATAETGYCNCGCGCGNDEMKVCFGADQVNDNGDDDFETCSATPEFGDEDAASPLEQLPGCNPIQSGPAKATPVTGEGCIATPAPNNGGNGGVKSSSSSALPSSISAPNVEEGNVGGDTPSKTSAVVDSTTSASPVVVASTTSAKPVVSDDAAYTPPSGASSTAADATGELPSLTLVSSGSPAEPTPSAGGDGECPAPVYVTITPTVYVTAGSFDVGNTTACGGETVYKTVTDKVTVTVPAPSGYKHGHHKRHAL